MSGRKINDGMGKFIADNIIKKLIQSDVVVRKAKVSILGITFKENCPDTRNTKVFDGLGFLNGSYDVLVTDKRIAEVSPYSPDRRFEGVNEISQAIPVRN